MPRIGIYLLLCAIFATAAPHAQADEVYTFVVKKQEEKAKDRWSLSDWLETRDRMRLMDLWLAIHSPTPYEFYLGGDYQFGTQSSGPSYNGADFFAAAYATIFGLGVNEETATDSRLQGLFLLRIFGFHDQATNITLHLGVRQYNGAISYRNAVAGASMTIYLARYFGVKGLYHHYFDSTPNATGVIDSGDQFEGEAFIDFKFLRVFGKYFAEPETWTSAAGSTDIGRSGVAIGTQLYF